MARHKRSDRDGTGFVALPIPDTLTGFKAIIGGTFVMGSPDGTKGTTREVNRDTNEVQHTVNISSFYMSKTEVTVQQYKDFCNAQSPALVMPAQPAYSKPNHPVVNITWFEAAAYAAYYSCRLPTEAEWEYAARAKTITPFYTGNCINRTQANYNWNNPYNNCTVAFTPLDRTTPVDSFPTNPNGLYNMAGNVWEWCYDVYDAKYYPTDGSIQTNPQGPVTPSSYRVIRGGSWYDFAVSLRSAFRNLGSPGNRYNDVGFRLAKTP